jgi:hypothetical protein
VFVIHFKIPTTPKTYLANPGSNDNGTVQARYESLCTYTSSAVATNIQQFEKCLNDQTMLPDRNRMVTVVLSTAQRQSQARESAMRRRLAGAKPLWQQFRDSWQEQEARRPGVLPGGRLGVGTDPYLYSVVIRQQLPNANFKRSFVDIPTNKIIKPFLGPYYPGARYMTARQFDRTHPCNGS